VVGPADGAEGAATDAAVTLAEPPADSPPLAPQAFCSRLLLERYARPGEHGADDVRHRVARALAQAERSDAEAGWAARFLRTLRNGFLTAGRISAGAGTALPVTLVNCFVQPVGDSPNDSALPPARPGPDEVPDLDTALAEAARTLQHGGGVGYDFSLLRPAGARGRAGSGAPGPVAGIRRFDQACQRLASAGPRRGAQMAVLRCDHPDVVAFVAAKDRGGLPTFNLSVGISDAFMHALAADGLVELVHRAEPGSRQKADGARRRDDGQWVYGSVPARALWDRIMRSTYDHGEPGVLFLDRINADNNLSYCERIAATNPCGEQPLPPYGGCCLGSMDLTRFVVDPFEPGARFDEAVFAHHARTAVRMLDNVLDLTPWPLPQQARDALAKRRIGLGFTGLADALILLNRRYDRPDGRAAAHRIATLLRDTAYAASVDLAEERGAFPLFDAAHYLDRGTFASRLSDPLKARIRRSGIRNSHLLSIAPAGSISLAFADNASSGIEPAYAWTTCRRKRDADGTIGSHPVEDHAWRLYRHLKGADAPLGPAFVTALEMTAEAQVEMVAAVAPCIDAAVSKTVNVPADCPFEGFRDLYLLAWRSGLKGLCSFRPNPVLGAVLGSPVQRPPT